MWQYLELYYLENNSIFHLFHPLVLSLQIIFTGKHLKVFWYIFAKMDQKWLPEFFYIYSAVIILLWKSFWDSFRLWNTAVKTLFLCSHEGKSLLDQNTHSLTNKWAVVCMCLLASAIIQSTVDLYIVMRLCFRKVLHKPCCYHFWKLV